MRRTSCRFKPSSHGVPTAGTRQAGKPSRWRGPSQGGPRRSDPRKPEAKGMQVSLFDRVQQQLCTSADTYNPPVLCIDMPKWACCYSPTPSAPSACKCSLSGVTYCTYNTVQSGTTRAAAAHNTHHRVPHLIRLRSPAQLRACRLIILIHGHVQHPQLAHNGLPESRHDCARVHVCGIASPV